VMNVNGVRAASLLLSALWNHVVFSLCFGVSPFIYILRYSVTLTWLISYNNVEMGLNK